MLESRGDTRSDLCILGVEVGESPLFFSALLRYRASQVALVVKNPPASAGNARDMGLIPRSERSPRVGNGTPLQYSCLENAMDGGA